MNIQNENKLLEYAKSIKTVYPNVMDLNQSITLYAKENSIEASDADICRIVRKTLMDNTPYRGDRDLDRFHLMNKKNQPTGVFDFAIFEYLKNEKALFVLGGVPYIYQGGAFRPDRSGAELKTMIRNLIYPDFIKSTTIKRIYDLFISDKDLQVSAEEINCYPVEWINFQNGFYDPVTKKMIPHDPKYKATNQIPHVYDPGSGLKSDMIQKWLSFICDTPEDIEMLCQFSGLCLTRDTRQQKFLILNGEGGTGKSTVIRMIERMVGTENTSNISLNQLTQRFQAFGLMGRLLNDCADLEIDALSDTSILKKALGEDSFSAESKGKDQISIRNYAKLIFSTNQLPIVKAEQTNGFYRRLLILTMDNVPEKRETDFFDRLSADIDDFIRISVQALERLYQNGQIVESSGSIEAVKRLRCDSDTVEAFLTAMTARVPDNTENRIKKSDLYQAYTSYCQDMERQSLTKQNFYRSMKAKGFGEIKTKTGQECFRGIIYRENLRQISVRFSVDGWKTAKGERIPFD